MGQAQINVRTCSRTSIARTKQAALTHNVRGKELMVIITNTFADCVYFRPQYQSGDLVVIALAPPTLDRCQ